VGVFHISGDQDCDYIQGYLLGKPIEEEYLKTMVTQNCELIKSNK